MLLLSLYGTVLKLEISTGFMVPCEQTSLIFLDKSGRGRRFVKEDQSQGDSVCRVKLYQGHLAHMQTLPLYSVHP